MGFFVRNTNTHTHVREKLNTHTQSCILGTNQCAKTTYAQSRVQSIKKPRVPPQFSSSVCSQLEIQKKKHARMQTHANTHTHTIQLAQFCARMQKVYSSSSSIVIGAGHRRPTGNAVEKASRRQECADYRQSARARACDVCD